jgi:hypothetical protein
VIGALGLPVQGAAVAIPGHLDAYVSRQHFGLALRVLSGAGEEDYFISGTVSQSP